MSSECSGNIADIGIRAKKIFLAHLFALPHVPDFCTWLFRVKGINLQCSVSQVNDVMSKSFQSIYMRSLYSRIVVHCQDRLLTVLVSSNLMCIITQASPCSCADVCVILSYRRQQVFFMDGTQTEENGSFSSSSY